MDSKLMEAASNVLDGLAQQGVDFDFEWVDDETGEIEKPIRNLQEVLADIRGWGVNDG